MRDLIGKDSTCMEKDCKFSFEGKTFESGGAFIGKDKNGKHGGRVYGNETKMEVSNWHGDIKVKASYGHVFRSNFGDKRRYVWFTWKGISFYGLWCSIDWNQLIPVKECKAI